MWKWKNKYIQFLICLIRCLQSVSFRLICLHKQPQTCLKIKTPFFSTPASNYTQIVWSILTIRASSTLLRCKVFCKAQCHSDGAEVDYTLYRHEKAYVFVLYLLSKTFLLRKQITRDWLEFMASVHLKFRITFVDWLRVIFW